ncbi:hypothetical protein F5X68DRAFT_207922 [Plectosphaerella plurivora]|uniref:Alpha/beta-hydrolase n=1 Tax=Plectosphaerella plurivora TaxID=936078 RepID=A0A9P8VCW9_9PEZI|nr:hypothetical protein F5X68DRAFT_207922 [Plectosphaerella plurivora]
MFSLSAAIDGLWAPLRRHEARRAARLQERMGSTKFFGSQVGGPSVISYSYTDLPSRLLMWDIYYFFQFAWALPWIIMPVTPSDSGELDELAFTWPNMFCVAMHALLFVLQAAFILAIPVIAFFPIYMAAVGIGAFLTLNWALCLLLNGPSIEYHSDEKYAKALPEHASEQWIFINGVAVGDHWMKSNLNRLALTFKRPVLGIHNQTSGIIFDVIECLVQRNFGYATYDVRMAYGIIKKLLYDPQLSKVVFILHSQGGIEGGLVLDWLLQELPQDLLQKLEVYSFGNAANHFNNPHRHVLSQALVEKDPLAAAASITTELTETTPINSPVSPLTHALSFTERLQPVHMDAAVNGKSNGNGLSRTPTLRKDSSSFSSTRTSTAAKDRALGHVEHYAHTTDFVALWGVLHFCTSIAAKHTMPRFIGRLFSRASDRGGHQFCQHYLDGMFPLARDSVTGELTGCAEENEFMESEVQVGEEGSAAQTAREAFEVSWLGAGGFGSGEIPTGVDVHGDSHKLARKQRRMDSGMVKVKDLSRLWMYRNGMSPPDTPPMLRSENGVVRNATM